MQAMPAMPMEPGRHISPAGESGGNTEPAKAETLFKQQLADAGQNNDTASQFADSGEQTPDGMTEQQAGEDALGMEVVPQVSIFSTQPWQIPVHGNENIIPLSVEAEGKQPTGNVRQDIVPPQTLQPTVMVGEDVTVNVADQKGNANYKPHIFDARPGGKPEITNEQNQAQLHTETAPDKQKNGSPIILDDSRGFTVTDQLGNKQKNITPLQVTQTPLRDTNGNYIQQNLPEISVSNKDNLSNNLQQQSGEEKAKADPGAVLQQQNSLARTTATDTPLTFSLSREAMPGSTSSTLSGDYTSSLRLPSGAEVPHSRIVDQVINRFSMNRSLESGTVIMKMYPAELGELRMKVTVDQENIRATIITQNPQVQEILDRYMSRLRDALEEQGLNLEHVEVSVGDNSGDKEQLFNGQFNQHLSDKRETNNFLTSITVPDDQIEGKNNLLPENSHRLSVLV